MGGDHQPSIGAMLDELAHTAGAVPAILAEDATITYAELAALTRRAAGGLAALGLGPGDRIAVWLPNVVEWLVLAFGAARLGAIAVSVNTRFRSSEVEDILARSGAKLLAVWPAFRAIPFLDI